MFTHTHTHTKIKRDLNFAALPNPFKSVHNISLKLLKGGDKDRAR